MHPAKALRELGQQLPNMLMGATDFPALITDSLHGLRQQAAWQDKQWRELQHLRMQITQQRRRDWLAGGTVLMCVMIANDAPWPVATIFMVLAGLMMLWRIIS
jgi:ubiquinone biosynthesis protein